MGKTRKTKLIQKRKSGIDFDRLPDLYLEEIFSYFGSETLPPLMFVCERWNHIILRSSELMRTFTLTIGRYGPLIDQFIPFGKLQNIILHRHHYLDDLAEEFIQNVVKDNRDHIRKFSFMECGFYRTENNFLNALDATTLFKDLSEIVREVEVIDSLFERQSEEFENIEWKKLEKLNIEKSNLVNLRLFQNAKLSKLELKLNISQRFICPSQNNDKQKLMTFFKNQKDSLKELHILNVQLDNDYFQHILNYKNLSKLELDINFLVQNPDLASSFVKMSNWKKISFKGGNFKPKEYRVFKDIIAADPCIVELKISKTVLPEKENTLGHIFRFIPHIEHLKLPIEYGIIQLSDKISFERLQVLELEVIKYQLSVQKLLLLMKMSENLKSLKIHWVGTHARLDGQFFVKLFEVRPNLEQLHVGHPTDTFEFTDDALQAIKTSGKNLKILSTFSTNVEDMRKKMRIFHEDVEFGVKCTAWNREYEDVSEVEGQKRQKVLSDELSQIATCTWCC